MNKTETDINKSYSVNNEITILAKGAGVSMAGKLGGRALLLLTQILLARLLGPTGFGLFALGQIVFQLGSQMGGLGLVSGMIRLGVPALQKGPEQLSKFFRHLFLIALLSGLAFGIAMMILAPWLALDIFKRVELTNVLRGFGLACTLLIWLNVTSAATRLTRDMRYSTVTQDMMPFAVNLILVVLFVYALHLSVGGAIAALIGGYAISFSMSLLFMRKLYPQIALMGSIEFPLLSNILSFSVPNMFTGILNLWLQNVTVLFLGFFSQPKEVGVFQAAEQISMFSAILLLAFSMVFSPQVSALYENREMDKLKELYIVSTKWGLYASIPLLIVIVFFPAQVMAVIFGDSYRNGASLLVILVLAQLINTATGSVAALLSMTGKQKLLLLRTIMAFALCIGLNLWLTPPLGMLGAAISLAVSISILNLLMLWDVRRLLGLWPYDRRYYKMGIALLVTGCVLFGANQLAPVPFLWKLMVYALLSVGVFGAALLALRLEAYEKAVLKKALRKFLTGSPIE